MPAQAIEINDGGGNDEGAFVGNLLIFLRLLRGLGFRLGSRDALDALAAIERIGVGNKYDFHAALCACLVKSPEQRALFDQAFEIFWRDISLQGRVDGLESLAQRIAQEMASETLTASHESPDLQTPDAIETNARGSFSSQERLGGKDFAQMSPTELAAARKAVAKIYFNEDARASHRLRPCTNVSDWLDMRAGLREGIRRGDFPALRYRKPAPRRVPIVALCDISGSMAIYSQMFLLFLHALAQRRKPLQAFVFGTRLTDVSGCLRHRDGNQALGCIASKAKDWDGGTRIGECLGRFNRRWGRRLLGQGALVLLISDGLDRGDEHALEQEAQRLRRGCHRLLWLNPLLRYEAFQPLAKGVRRLLPQVDGFLPAHNLNSLEDLARRLSPFPRA